MSLLVRDTYPTVQAIIFDPTKANSGVGSGATSTGFPAGTLYYDATSNTFQGITASGVTGVQQTPSVQSIAAAVTNTNATTATALMTYAFQPGQLNVVGKSVYIYAAGEYTTDSGTGRTMTVAVTAGDGTNTRTLLTWTSGATTASQTAFPWNFDGYLVTQATGSSGTEFAHGGFNVTLGSTQAGAVTSYNDVNAAASSALNLTKTITLTVTQLFSGSNAANTFTEDTLIVSILN